MAFARVFARAAQRYLVVDGAVVANLRRFANHDAHAVVDEQAAADAGAGMDFDAGEAPAPLADHTRQEPVAPAVEKVGRPVKEQDVKARVEQQNFRQA